MNEDRSVNGVEKVHEGNVLVRVGVFFLIANTFERACYFGLTGQLMYIYTAAFGQSQGTAAKYQAVFQTLAYISPLLGAVLADRFLGRFKTILCGYPAYISGLLLCVLSQLLSVVTWKEPTSTQSTLMSVMFTIGLCAGIAVGAGLLKVNILVLGADQFDGSRGDQRTQQQLFFSTTYLMNNIAAFCGYFFMSTLAVNGVGKLKGYKNKSLRVFVVALISIAFMVLSAATMVAASPVIIKPKPKGSVLMDFLGAVKESWTANVYSIMVVVGTLLYAVGTVVAMVGFFISDRDSGATSYISAVLIVSASVCYAVSGPNSEWIENSSTDNGGSYPPELIVGFRAILSIFRFIPSSVIFWLVFNSMNTLFVMQGCVMKTQVFGFYNMPSSQVPAWNGFVIVLFVPFHERILYPLVERCGINVTLLRKSGYGLAWTVIAMLVAAGLELLRKNASLLPTQSSCHDSSSEFVMERNLNVLLLIFAYASVAMSEIGYAISCYEFFYSQVPKEVRSVVQSFNFFTTSLGTAASGVIVTVFESWVPNNLDGGHIEYLYVFIAAIAFINVLIFTFIAANYHYVDFYGSSDTSSISDAFNDDNKE